MLKPVEPTPPNYYLLASNVMHRWYVGTHHELPFEEFKTELFKDKEPFKRRFLRIDRIVEATNEQNDEVTISLVEETTFKNPDFEVLNNEYLDKFIKYSSELSLYNSLLKDKNNAQ